MAPRPGGRCATRTAATSARPHRPLRVQGRSTIQYGTKFRDIGSAACWVRHAHSQGRGSFHRTPRIRAGVSVVSGSIKEMQSFFDCSGACVMVLTGRLLDMRSTRRARPAARGARFHACRVRSEGSTPVTVSAAVRRLQPTAHASVGQRTGLITSWGGGAFGFMRSLALLGPLIVPQIAQMGPTNRQRMQRLTDELAAEGLVDFIDNPKHQRSKLVRLTPEGDARYRVLSARLLSVASTMGLSLSEASIRKTSEILRQLSADVTARSESPS